MSRKIVFINSHPIQYFAPLYQYLAKQNLDIEAWYCSDESIKGGMDKEFGVPVIWDVPLLEGYKSIFFKNHAFNKGIHQGFFGLINFGLIKALKTKEKKIIVVPGWKFFSYVLAIIGARIFGHTVCMRAETPLAHKLLKKGFLQYVKNGVLKELFHNFIHHFLYIGAQNKKYYQSFGISDEKLIFTPYAVDNDRFKKDFIAFSTKPELLKKQLEVPLDKFVILYSGKFIDKKRPLDLLNAIRISSYRDKFVVVFMGEGILRQSMTEFISKYKMKDIFLTGFVNQTDVTKYYAVSNLFVMCSGTGETWGLSTNEAMNFGLPVVLSHLTGCSDDLVKSSINGYVFQTGDIAELSKCLDDAYLKFGKSSNKVCNASLEIIQDYSFQTIANNLSQLV